MNTMLSRLRRMCQGDYAVTGPLPSEKASMSIGKKVYGLDTFFRIRHNSIITSWSRGGCHGASRRKGGGPAGRSRPPCPPRSGGRSRLHERDPFFDARDLVQVKYEMLRRVQVEGQAVATTAAAFGFSRPSFYAAQTAWQDAGLPGLLPARPGPRGGHKLTAAVVDVLLEQRARDPQVRTAQLVALVHEQFGLVVHPRSIERALARHTKKVRRTSP